ncbi:MAG: rhodanese-like domain-containing protein [Planctomycetaceae bacterium]|nr:rhodanese-like domain-containing protein [Planctomycetaceae bacterium]
MQTENPLEVDLQTVKQKLDQNEDFVLLDCREQDEFDLVHIHQAQLLPMSLIEQKVSELDGQQDKEIIVYCHHGSRSLMVTKWLLGNGFNQVKSMAGGIDLWAEQIDSEMTRY